MAGNTQYTVTISSTSKLILAAAVNAAWTLPRSVLVTNSDAAEILYWGFEDPVTTANGTPLAAGAQIAFDLIKGEEIWAIRGAAADIDVRVADLRP
jgi:hypothetical protein